MLGVQIVEGERAAGLIITMNQDHAPQVQRLVLRVTGETAERTCSREKYMRSDPLTIAGRRPCWRWRVSRLN